VTDRGLFQIGQTLRATGHVLLGLSRASPPLAGRQRDPSSEAFPVRSCLAAPFRGFCSLRGNLPFVVCLLARFAASEH